MSRSALANPQIAAPVTSPNVRRLVSLVERWQELVEVAVDAPPGSRQERDADAAVDVVDRQIERLAQAAMRRPARTPDDVVVLALIAHHKSASHFDQPTTLGAIRSGAAAWMLAREIITLAGYPRLIRINGGHALG